ncbi:unnamed protein product, partial [Rotaria sp. Silwood1]
IGNIHDIFDETTDEFIGDKGFRDADDERITVRIPLSLQKGQTRLSIRDANTKRKITKLRNCIERGFGRLKQWKIIGSIIDTNLIFKIGSLLKILGAVDNIYLELLFVPTNNDEQDINFIKHREVIQNVLEDLPTNQWITRQLQDVVHFISPLSLNVIRNYGLGEYALKLAIPYLQYSSTISIKTYKSKQYSNIIKIEGITSRYSKKTSPKQHKIFLQFVNDNDDEENDVTLSNNYNNNHNEISLDIKGINLYCSCKSGARTVEACAHVIAALYWLYSNTNGVPILNYSAKSVALQQNITNLQPFNQHRRQQKADNIDVIPDNNISDTEENESCNRHDFVIANAQDQAGINNANFATPPDGQSGVMNMYLWNRISPGKDGIFELGIIIHEYGHGLSNRLTGGPANSDCLNTDESGGMGEGWSDVLAVVFRQKSENKRTDTFFMGNYVFGGQGI